APPALLAMYALVAAMLLTRTAELNVRGACAYVVVVCVAGLAMVVNASLGPPDYVSVTSFLLLVVLYAPFAVSLAPQAASPAMWRQVLRLYIAFATLVAACGAAQFAAQFVVRPAWLFDFSPLIPPALRASGEYNTVNPVGEWI